MITLSSNISLMYFPCMGLFFQIRIVVGPWQESATKDLTYLKKMIQSLIMQKMEIPGLVTGIGLILGTIVLLVYTIQ